MSPDLAAYVFPASFSQRRLWFLQQLEPGQTSYLVPMAWRFKGALSLDALSHALNRIVERHDTMRTSFAVEAGEPIQVVNPYQAFAVDVDDLAGQPDPEAAARVEAVREANTPFDLKHDRMFRARVLRLGEDHHILLATTHHIAFDGWSRGVWTREFLAFYREAVTGVTATVPELEIQYGDYAAWQQEHLTGQRLDDELAYWKAALDGAPTLLDLPKDRPRTQDVSPDGALIPLSLGPELSAALRQLAHDTQTTLFMVMLAGLHVLLARYSGQEDLLVGTPIANRERMELEPLIGFFVNTLLLRGRVAPGDTFLDILAEVKRTTLDAYSHQEMPFEKLVETLAPERSLSFNPLFQVMFALHNTPREAASLPGLEMLPMGGGRLKTKLDLFFSIVDGTEGIRGGVEYSLALYDAATIERMVGHYKTLLTRLVENPESDATATSFLAPDEAQHLLECWNRSATVYPRDQTLPQLFEQQASATPQNPAVSCGPQGKDRTLTYAELNEQANRLAHALAARGVAAGSLVGVCLHRSERILVALLAVMKTGAAYLPLDPNYPQERLRYILEDTGSALVLSEDEVLPLLPNFAGEALSLDALAEELATQPTHNLNTAANAETLAYVLHTSGSTGKPKGVEITQRNLVNFLLSMQRQPGLNASDTLLAVTTLSFDISGLEFYLPLIAGARVVLATRDQAIEAQDLMDLLKRWRVSVMQATPATWLMLFEAGWKGDPKLKVLCGGEALPPELAARLASTCGELWNMYGPTETTIWSAVALIEPPANTDAAVKITLGHPIANTTLHVLDGNRQPVPAGVLGELYIGGDGVGRGYWNKPELTAERFVEDPFAAEPARMFRTGDLCRRLSDGTIEYMGRADHQVKIRGFRIELGEIEAVLARQPAVQQVVVVAREDNPGDKRIVAYLVAQATDEAKAGTEESEAEQVARWAAAWDDSYQSKIDPADATFNLSGWNSSYTGEPIPVEDMREWVDATVARILAIGARRIWEIGCGTGLLLFRVAPSTTLYQGTDISPTAIESIGRLVARPDIQLPQVRVLQRPAHVPAPVEEKEAFNLVVINSVIQYFPDAAYLAQVLTRAIDSLDAPAGTSGGGGSVFIGDVRNQAQLELFRLSVELANAPDALARKTLLQRVEKAVRQEAELVVDPEFFHTLKRLDPRIRRVEIQLKRGTPYNELTLFRYDVTLHLGDPAAHTAPEIDWLDWTAQAMTPERLHGLLNQEPDTLAFTRIPNARLQAEVTAAALLEGEDGAATAGDLRYVLNVTPHQPAVNPELLYQLAEKLPYTLELRPSHAGADGFFDALFLRKAPAEIPAIRFPGESNTNKPWHAYTNNPLQQSISRALIPQLREWITERLPEYMMPAAFVVLEAMPLSANGKVNRRALPAPEFSRDDNAPYLAPRTEIEIQIAAIWAEALHIPQIGLADDFFALGGHSLLGTQVVSRIRKAFSIELPLRALFETPTLEGLAATVEQTLNHDDGVRLPQLLPADRTRPLPLSFAQQRFWFLDQLEPGNAFYNMPIRWRMRGALDLPALEAAITAIVARHETLRTTFAAESGGTVQVIAPAGPVPLAITDLSRLSESEREARARTLVTAEATRPFDLQAGPIFRAVLFVLSPQEHVLVLNAHHIATDGWSSGILRQELFTLYEAFRANPDRAGKPSPLAPLPIQYADYAVWQRAFLADALACQLAYWKQHLTGAPPSIDLPTDRPRPAIQTYRGASHAVLMPPELLEALKAVSQREGATLFMTLLAAFNILLARYSGQTDIVVGTAIAGRTHSDTEKLIGLFVNTLVLRNDLAPQKDAGNLTFAEFLARVRETTVNAYANQDLPFEKLVEELDPVRDSSRSPLYQVMLVLQNTPSDRTTVASLEISGFGTAGESSKLDLVLSMAEVPSGLRASLLFNTDLFDRSTIERMLGQFQHLLEEIARRPRAALAHIDILPQAERDLLLYGLNDTATAFPLAPLHVLFERQADRTPEATALRFGTDGATLTYRELDRASSRFARALIARGVRPGDILGLCLERSFDMPVAIFGIFKAGAAYLALDPSYPDERLSMMLEDGTVARVIGHEATRARIPVEAEAMLLEDLMSRDLRPEGFDETRPAIAVELESPAVVIHTSGSTGRPKGAMLHHGGLANFMFAMQQIYPLTPDDRFLLKTSLNFDASMQELLWPLFFGAQVVIAPPDRHFDLEAMAALIAAQSVTFVFLVPSLLAAFLGLPDIGRLASTLRRVLSGGEKVTPQLVTRFEQQMPGAVLYQGYGPAEGSIGSAFAPCLPDYPYGVAPLGRPIANVRLYVVDENMQPVPHGVAGELILAGAGVGLGYLNRPDLTAERFFTDPFTGAGRAYKTGDRVRYLPDNNLVFVDRLDFQIKLRGLRIELNEIEATLRTQAGIEDVVVVAREDDAGGDKKIVAYYVAGAPVDADTLRTHLRATLPDYMVPAAFVALDRLPLSLNGKVDRKALPAPDFASLAATAGRAPVTRTQVALAGIWQELLHISFVNLEDDFFQLGGHSLLATQMVSRARAHFAIDLPLIRVFTHSTLEAFAGAVDEAAGSAAAASLRNIVRPERVPLSYGQQRFWFLDQLEPGSSFYNVTVKWRLRGELDLAAIEAAVDALVARHETLRTTFAMEDGETVQRIAPAGSTPLPLTDLSGQPDPEREGRDLVTEESRRPIDLAHGPIFRAGLLRLSPDDHVIFLVTHHIATDGWSSAILRQELFTLYEAFAAGEPNPLPPLPIQYADYSVWQRTFLTEALARQTEYWKAQLAGAPPSIDLPTDRPRPAIQTYRGAAHSLALSATLVEALKAAGQPVGATLFMTLLAAFNILLARYSGQDDIVIGTAIAGRTHSDTEKLIGLFVNTLALRTDLGAMQGAGSPASAGSSTGAGSSTFAELLARVRDTTINAYANQDLPFEKLVEEINPVRDSSRSPLYQVMLVLQNTPADRTVTAGLEIGGFGTSNETSQMDLTLNLAETASGMNASLRYNTDLFDAATIRRMLAQFELLLEQVAAAPATPIAALSLLAPGERELLLDTWAGPTLTPTHATLHASFEAQAERTPNAVALVAGDERLTYGELNRRANQLAHLLVARGAGPETLVGIFCGRGFDLLTGVLAILKTGAAYVPLDPMYPAERIAHILADANAPLVLTQAALLDKLPAFSGHILALDNEAGPIAQQPATNPGSHGSPNDLAYVLFTSGSTGRPKGVAIEHRSAATFVAWAHTVYTPAELAGVLFSTSICFDLSIFEIFVPLSVGGEIVIAENALYLPELPAREQVTLINTVPSAIAELVRMQAVPDSVTTINLAGEALRQDLVEQIYANTQAVRVYNLYGPTEDTTYSTFTLVERGRPVTIGKPLANTQALILDAERNLLPVGLPGELYLAGDGLARGYYGQPELTAERFLDNPFKPGTRMYRTGDLCRWLLPEGAQTGEIEYRGRLDHQVKLRGFRIELGEIEAQLRTFAGVQQAVVLVREDTPGDRRLVAYLVGENEPDATALRKHLQAALPDYMMPAAFVALERLPLTPNGKLDRKALPAPRSYTGAETSTGTPPQTPTEVQIAEIWMDILKIAFVNREDDFFRLGGHSLLATQMISRVRTRYGIELPLIEIFAHTTLDAFAEIVQQVVSGGAAGTLSPLLQSARPANVPLSYAQQRLWFLNQLEPDNPFYNVVVKWRLRGALHVDALQAALTEIVARHEALRTTFSFVAGEPVQIIAPRQAVPLDVIETGGEDEARRLVGEASRRPFDLKQGPLFRATLLALAEQEHVVILNTHHIVTDGWSTGVLRNELAALYAAFRDGKPSPLPPLPLQYADYAAWQRTHVEGAVLDRQLAYWKDNMLGAPPAIELPTDRPRPATQTYRGGSRRLALPAALVSNLKTLSKEEGATLFMTLLAAFNILLSRYAGQDDVVVGTAIAGRTHTDTEKLIGLFVNSLALRNQVPAGIAFRTLLAHVRQTTVHAFENQDVPFERLVEALNPVRDASRNPLYQVMLVLQNTPGDPAPLAGLQLSPFGAAIESSQMDLTLMVSETGAGAGAGLSANLIFNTDLFDPATIERMLLHFQRVLEGVVATPGLPVSELALVSPAEHDALLALSHGPTLAPANACLHTLFERQAALTPEATALVAGYERLTYAELNQRANQIAHGLRRRGAGPDVLIGIFCERGFDLLAGVLGILKAGAAYVPLDPMYPAGRIAGILEDANAPLVLTQTALAAQLPAAFTGERLTLDTGPFAQESTANPIAAGKPGNLAYVLFTSGSTGRPKGVAIEHRSAATFVAWAHTVFSAEDLAGVLFSTSICFDLSVFEIFVTLSAGGAVVIAENALYLPELPGRNEVTLINTVPSAIAELVHNDAVPAPVRVVNLAGEALRDDLVESIYSSTGVVRVYNLYGPTEDTTYSTFTLVERHAPVTIGRPLANTQALVLDPAGHLLPIGVPGELYLAGEGLARGYYGRPDLTAERFLPNPFKLGSRMYRTGDVCLWTPAGQLQYIGRADFQVKLRGFRIELGEVEAALARQPEVRDSVVLVREDTPGDKRLVAYVVASVLPGVPALSPADWRARLKQFLPDYMVPTAFVALDRLPLTPNGKIARALLPAPTAELFTAPPRRPLRTRMELLLADIWKDVLNLPSVQVDDDFFMLGGHSLMAATMMNRLRETLGYAVRLSALFEAPTLGALAALAEKQGATEATVTTLVPIRRTGSKPPVFCVSRPNVNALGFLFLARAVSAELPIYGLQSNMENDGVIQPFTQQDYEEKAREYIAAMRAVRPEGPYFLAGFCEGAHIAFEMARQLEAMRLEVGAVFILDVWPIENTISRTRFNIRNYGRVLRAFAKADNAGRLKMAGRRLNNRRAVAPKRDAINEKLNRNPDVDIETLKQISNLTAARYWPGKDFKPTIFHGNLVVFRMVKQPFHRIHDDSLGWRPRVRGRVDIVNVPGEHALILRDPGVSVVARELEAYIDRYLKA